MSNGEAVIAWGGLDDISDIDLAVVSAAAVHVVQETAALDNDEQPRSVIAQELRDALEESGLAVTAEEASFLVSDAAATRVLALTALAGFGADTTLRAEIDDAYAKRSDLMVLDPGSLLAGALVVLAIKLKRIKVGDVKIEFFELKTNLIDQIRELLGR